ncbi:uncharacterized protein LOC144713606 isoform X2 [Wolffia australiana]
MASRGGGYVKWEEIVVCREKGRREVHYYLKNASGAADLAVVGKERSARHMSYAVPSQFFRESASLATSSVSPSNPAALAPGARFSLKLRSRRDVIDWLSSAVSDPFRSSDPPDEQSDGFADVSSSKHISFKSRSHRSKGFSWLGSFWACSKQRKHYNAFLRHATKISVQDFVYVTVEGNKRRVAYVEDMYEDLTCRKKVVVRWLRLVDEVKAVPPSDINDREIFFSLCLQDVSADRIDGLAAVLSPQHYYKCLGAAETISWSPFICQRQISGVGSVEPFDVTSVRGYWNQEILRCLIKSTESTSSSGLTSDEVDISRLSDADPSSRKRPSPSGEAFEESPELKSRRVDGVPVPLPPRKDQAQTLIKGQHVEVLSQDSGLRGCWFRCLVLKLRGDKVKVRYTDLQNADESGPLEGPRLALADKLGLRQKGRPSIRPQLQAHSKLSPAGFNVGGVVDAWWHDGWWEGLVISKEDGNTFRVYFPGEERTCDFEARSLRHAQDWSQSRWHRLRERPDMVNNLLAEASSLLDGKEDEEGPALDDLLGRLRWSSSRKRCRRRQRCAGHWLGLLKPLAADNSSPAAAAIPNMLVS